MRTIDHRTYQQLKLCFGQWASWALWNPYDITDLSIMEPRGIPHPLMRADLVFVGLNAARPTSKDWEAFHTGKKDHVLEHGLNNAVFGGAYLTDILKGFVEVNGEAALDTVKKDRGLLRKSARLFCKELKLLGAGADTTIIVFGKKAWEILELMKEKGYFDDCPLHEVNVRRNIHYSAYVPEERITDDLASHVRKIIPKVSYSEE